MRLWQGNRVLFQDSAVVVRHYEEFFREHPDHSFIAAGYRWIHQRTVDRLEPGSRILDVGCGSGQHARHFARKGLFVSGVDISPAAIEQCRAAFERLSLTGDFRVCDAQALPYENGTFDAAFLSLVLHQFRNYERVLAEVARVVRRFVFVLEPNWANPSTFLRLNVLNPLRDSCGMGRTERAVRAGSVRRIMGQYGFRETQRFYVSLDPAVQYRWLRHMLKCLESLLPAPFCASKFLQVFKAVRPLSMSVVGKRPAQSACEAV